MPLCQCEFVYPKCQYHHCERRAVWSVLTPPIRRFWPHGTVMFMCEQCKTYYLDAISKPLKGIDKPPGADDDWCPSLMDHLRFAQIDEAFEKRNELLAAPLQPNPLDAYWLWYEKWRGFTPAQIVQSRTHRALIKKYSETQGQGS